MPASEEDESCGVRGLEICEQHRALRMALGPQKQWHHPSMDTKVPPQDDVRAAVPAWQRQRGDSKPCGQSPVDF